MSHTYEPESVGAIAERARTSEETARKHLRHLTEDGFVKGTSTREQIDPLYRRSPESLILEEACGIRDEVDSETLVERVSEMQERMREYREESGAESPEDTAIRDRDIDAETLQDWQTTRRNLVFARVALALNEAEDTIAEGADYE